MQIYQKVTLLHESHQELRAIDFCGKLYLCYLQCYLPAQNMLLVILTLVDFLQTSWFTMGTLTCCRTVGRLLGSVTHVSFKFPQPVTLPLNPASISLWKEAQV